MKLVGELFGLRVRNAGGEAGAGGLLECGSGLERSGEWGFVVAPGSWTGFAVPKLDDCRLTVPGRG